VVGLFRPDSPRCWIQDSPPGCWAGPSHRDRRVACDSLALKLEDPGLVMPARRIADRKLPNKRRTVRSDGCIEAFVLLSAVGGRPWSWTNSRRATTASSTRESATSGRGTASPSNTLGGFALWELRSTTTTSGIHQGPLRSWCRLRRRVLRGFRHDHGSRDDSDRVLPVSRCHEYGACGSDLAQHGRDRIDQGAAICARMASLQRGLG